MAGRSWSASGYPRRRRGGVEQGRVPANATPRRRPPLDMGVDLASFRRVAGPHDIASGPPGNAKVRTEAEGRPAAFPLEPTGGLEPPTYALQVRCAANCAT